MQFMFAARRGRRVLQRFNLQQTATLSTRVSLPVSHARRAFRLADNRTAPLINNNGHHSIERFTALQRNNYSASAAKPPPKKTKAKTTKKPTKKKSAKQPKKELTPEELEKKESRKKDLKIKNEIKELKALTLKNEEPKLLPTSPWPFYLKGKLQGIRGEEVRTAFKTAAEEFKNISASEREALERQSANSKEQNEKTYAEWVKSFTPLQIKTANHARKRLAAITTEHRKHALKYPQIKDERLVKQPTNSFILFTIDRNKSGEFDNLSFKEKSDHLNHEWANLPEEEKERYTQRAAEDKERYFREYREVYGEEPPSLAKSTAKPKAAGSA